MFTFYDIYFWLPMKWAVIRACTLGIILCSMVMSQILSHNLKSLRHFGCSSSRLMLIDFFWKEDAVSSVCLVDCRGGQVGMKLGLAWTG
ncbi:hypothetical protein L6452_15424 [Arctium lappa]|uniref:Uncharacterized protein n=1 Tax=Arctium lappa TaxID=4217 RepID=A0ACB9CNP3_ARCLA|nr:hypothetical protein L6452_15424 [Arctium lappa]